MRKLLCQATAQATAEGDGQSWALKSRDANELCVHAMACVMVSNQFVDKHMINITAVLSCQQHIHEVIRSDACMLTQLHEIIHKPAMEPLIVDLMLLLSGTPSP